MGDRQSFEKKRAQIFSLLFDMTWDGKKIWEHIRDEYLSATPAFEGELYQEAGTKIMFVGRDLNGWDEPIGDCSTLENTVCSITNQKGAFDTFVDERGFGGSGRRYYHKNSNFFRFIKHVLEFVGESEVGIDENWYTDSKKWHQRFVWANLHCISPRRPKALEEAHPDNAMVKMGIEHYVELMEEYINYYKPDAVVFITDVDGWFIRWKRKRSFKDIASNYQEVLDSDTIAATGTIGSSKIIVCKRPDRYGKSYEDVKRMAKIVSDGVLR